METGSDILLEDGGSTILENSYHKGQTGTITTSNGATAEIVNINPADATTTLGMFSNKIGKYPIDGLSTLGEAKVRIYFKSKEIDNVKLKKGDIISLIDCEHSFSFQKDTILQEIKQGPYIANEKVIYD